MRCLLFIVLMLGVFSAFSQDSSNVEFVTPFKNTLEEAIVDCDTVFQYLDSFNSDYAIEKIEEWDSGYIVVIYDTDWGYFTIYYYDAKDDIRLDTIKGLPE